MQNSLDLSSLRPAFEAMMAKLLEADRSTFLNDGDKAAAKEKIRAAYEQKQPLKRKFGMWNDDEMLALRAYIKQDESRPKNVSAMRLWDLLTVIYLRADRDGCVKRTKEQLAEETGLSMNNLWTSLKYLRGLGVVFQDQQGSVPMPKSLEKAGIDIMENIYRMQRGVSQSDMCAFPCASSVIVIPSYAGTTFAGSLLRNVS